MTDRPFEGVNESCVSWLGYNEDPDRSREKRGNYSGNTKESVPAVWPGIGHSLWTESSSSDTALHHNMATANEDLERREERNRQDGLEGQVH